MTGTRDFALVTVAGRERLRAPERAGFPGAAVAGAVLSELTPENPARVRALEPRLAARPVGLPASFGFGDRIGIATSGHVRALRRSGASVVPVLAQQSVRELERSGRTHREVLDAATWGALRSGWLEGYGADADHLKEPVDVAEASAAGYTTYTLDPSDYVREDADGLSPAALEARFARLPWRRLDDDQRALLARQRQPVDLDSGRIGAGDDLEVMRAAVKYALAHAAVLAAGVSAGAEIELSIDEITSSTTPFEHVFVVRELECVGVRLIGLAPRFRAPSRKGSHSAAPSRSSSARCRRTPSSPLRSVRTSSACTPAPTS